jgi:hypothetical protein
MKYNKLIKKSLFLILVFGINLASNAQQKKLKCF